MQGCTYASGFQLSRHHGLQNEGLPIHYLPQCGLYLDDQHVVVLPLCYIIYKDKTSRSVDRCESLNDYIKKKKISIINYAGAQCWMIVQTGIVYPHLLCRVIFYSGSVDVWGFVPVTNRKPLSNYTVGVTFKHHLVLIIFPAFTLVFIHIADMSHTLSHSDPGHSKCRFLVFEKKKSLTAFNVGALLCGKEKSLTAIWLHNKCRAGVHF